MKYIQLTDLYSAPIAIFEGIAYIHDRHCDRVSCDRDTPGAIIFFLNGAHVHVQESVEHVLDLLNKRENKRSLSHYSNLCLNVSKTEFDHRLAQIGVTYDDLGIVGESSVE